MTAAPLDDAGTRDDDLLADLFDTLLQDILEGRTPDLEALHPDRPDLRDRIRKTWQLACSVAGRREPSRPVLGGYEIVRELGHGGMGTVYLARHQTLQRDVAIKVLPHSLAMSPRAKQRFLEEAKSLARIRHDHVVHIHRIIDHAEMLAFEMEYIDGPSLQTLIQALRQEARPWSVDGLQRALGQPLDGGVRSGVEWFVRLGIRVARALAEVHRHGLIHRDVKPSNILLRRDGTPVLADFGLALADDPAATRTNFAGTPVYAAPERLRGGDRGVDARTDVYSLGVTLYEALTTSPPFAGSSTHEVLRRIENGSTPPLRAKAPHVPRDLAVVIHKAMEPDPRHRYADADAFADDLERLLSLQPIHARPAGPLRRTWQFVRRHHRLVAAAAAGALLVAAVAWPLAAHAASSREAEARAAAEAHRARSRLLAPDSLPAAWTTPNVGGVVARNRAAETARARAFAASLAAYDEALRATPADARLRAERDAVVAAAQACAGDGAPPPASAGPLLRRLVANATGQRRLDDGLGDLLATAPEADRLAGGLFAFLWGDASTSTRCWDSLPPTVRDDMLLDACGALQLAGQGAFERAYPRLFHAARAFPAADAIALALADAALAAGDAALARQWLERLPPAGDVVADARRQRLAADLQAATGARADAARSYRELAHIDPTDPTPLLRLAGLQLQDGDRPSGKRLLQSLLARWPGLAAARVQLARLALQEHDVPEYLAHVREAVGSLRRDGGTTAAWVASTLHLGGLQQICRDLAPTAWSDDGMGRDEAIPLHAWLRPGLIEGIGQALRVVTVFDTASERCAAADSRPAGVLLRAGWQTLVQLPRLTLRLPAPLPALLLAGLPLTVDAVAAELTVRLAPYARALGVRMHTTRDRALFRREPADQGVPFGATTLRVDDLDGDTLPELVFASPPTSRSVDSGFVEIRDLADTSVLRTWRHADDNAMFARAMAVLGDVDGDLCADLALGAPLRRDAPAAVAAVELWSGRHGTRIWRRENDLATYGTALAGLGDLDGDGIGELLVGRPPLSLDDGPPGSAELLSGRSGAVLRTLVADRDDVWFGGAVAAGRDASGDGRPDLFVGGNFGRAAGLVAVFDGTTGGLLASYTDPNPETDFGSALLAVDDLDGDGRADVVVAAPARSGRSGDPGRVVVFGSRTGKALYELRGERAHEGFGNVVLRLPDWRRDGRPALVVGSVAGGPHGSGYLRVFDLASGSPLQTFAGNPGHVHFGYAITDLGDRDGDGLRDLAALSLLRDRSVLCFALSFADAYPQGEPGRPR